MMSVRLCSLFIIFFAPLVFVRIDVWLLFNCPFVYLSIIDFIMKVARVYSLGSFAVAL